MVKDIEAMDASILKGEPASGKKQKVPICVHENHSLMFSLSYELS